MLPPSKPTAKATARVSFELTTVFLRASIILRYTDRHQRHGTIWLVVDVVDAGATLALHDVHIERRGFDCSDVLRLAGWTPNRGCIDGHHYTSVGSGSCNKLPRNVFRPGLGSSPHSIYTFM
jgi:hypothetical protein